MSKVVLLMELKRCVDLSCLVRHHPCGGPNMQCWGKLLLKVMHYNIALLPKK